MNVRFNNTGAAVNQTLDVTTGGTTISAPINVADGTISVVVGGLDAQVGGFVTLTGDMGFKKNAAGRLIAAGNNVNATLDVGGVVEAGVSGATVGLIVTPDQKLALQATGGTSSLTLGERLRQRDGHERGRELQQHRGRTWTARSPGWAALISAPVNVVDGVTSVTVTGLEATVVDFVTISGNFGLEKTAGGDLEVVGNSVNARLQLAGDLVDVGVTGAKLGVLVKADETLALQTTGGR